MREGWERWSGQVGPTIAMERGGTALGITRRTFMVGAGAVVGNGMADTVAKASPAARHIEADSSRDWPVLNDASGLSPVRVRRHVVLSSGGTHDIEALRAELAAAREGGYPMTVSAARHSMGGQSLARDGVAATLAQSGVDLDATNATFRVQAGVRWHEVIRRLDAEGWSPSVMQSNNDFGVASTFCVNAHGWPVAHGPFGSTVRSIRMMLADGEVIECSREREAELFFATMGGYGLTGIVLDLDVAMRRNLVLDPTYELMDPEGFGERFASAATDPGVEMAYGRMDVTTGSFFRQAMMVTYRSSGDDPSARPVSGSGFLSRASRHVFRAQLGSDAVKRVRWGIETRVAPILQGTATRNSLLNEPVVTLDDGDPGRTDILHEYFVDPVRFGEFVAACRDVIPSSYQDLLNVTLRYVDADRESFLSYAPEPRIAAVLLFSQETSVRADEDMARMTRELVHRVLEIGGTYYLPYRLHATTDQFHRAYPANGRFSTFKRTVDPTLAFRNSLWDRYLAGGDAT